MPSDNEALSRDQAERPNGLLLVDKPAGWTSFDVVAVVRKTIGIRRVGHGGTLDPNATGLLAVLVGGATRSFDTLREAPKVYAAVVRFGSEMDTDDAAGTMTREMRPPARAEAETALASFRGVIQQTPPSYAAVKIGGRPAYAIARRGEDVELAAREVQVMRLDVTGWNGATDLGLLVVCSSGTYIRSIARDLGRAVSSAAHLLSLRRLAIGALDVRDAIGVEEVRRNGREHALSRLRPFGPELVALDPRYLSESAPRLAAAERSS